MMFESNLHPHNVFVTLTYSDEALPTDGNINKRDPQLFLKRLRKRLDRKDGRRFRYYLCGEYGERNTKRPHYHAILFNVSLADHEAINQAWDLGITSISELTPGRVKYTAAYVQKKIIKQGVEYHPDGRRSEFALMSRMPGLGSGFLSALATALHRLPASDVAIAGTVRVDGKKHPLDRYGRNILLRTLVDLGRSEEEAATLVYNYEEESTSDPHAFNGHAKKIENQERYLRVRAGNEGAKTKQI